MICRRSQAIVRHTPCACFRRKTAANKTPRLGTFQADVFAGTANYNGILPCFLAGPTSRFVASMFKD